MKKLQTVLLAAAFALAIGVPAASAQVINVQFTDNQKNNSLNGTAYDPSQEALAYSGATWNTFFGNPLTATTLSDSNGVGTGVGFTLTNPYASAGPGASANAVKIHQEAVGGYQPYTFTLDGLASSPYDLYLYSAVNGASASFTINGLTQTPLGNDSAVALNGDYVLFSAITPTNGSITVNIDKGNNYGDPFQGFQLAPAATVPEPSTVLLLAASLGGLALMMRRRLA